MCLSALPMLAPSASAAPAAGFGKVVLCTDDLSVNRYETMYPILSEAGLVATWFVTSSNVDNVPGGVTSDMLREVQAAGWEIGSHGVTHTDLTSISIEEAEVQLADSKAALEAMGLDVTSFAWPFGATNAALRDIATKYYDRTRDTNPYSPMYLQEFPSHLDMVGCISEPSLEMAQAAIDRAVATNSVAILLVHNLDANGTMDNGVNFHDIVSYIKRSGVQSITMSDLPNTRDLYLWDGEGADELASNPANWRKIALDGTITNDAPLASNANYGWNWTSGKNCTWDIDDASIVAYSLVMNTGYTGTITQAATADIGVGRGGMVLRPNTPAKFVGSTSRAINCDGDFYKKAALSTTNINLRMTGDGSSISVVGYTPLNSLHISADVTVRRDTSQVAYPTVTEGGLTVDPWVTLTLRNNILVHQRTGYGGLNNYGLIDGPEALIVSIYNEPPPFSPGRMTAPMEIVLSNQATASRVVTISTPWDDFAGPLTVRSSHATHTLTLDAAGYDLMPSALTVGTNAILLGGDGTITTETWDTADGTWIPEESTVVLLDGGSARLAYGQSFNRLEIASEDRRTATCSILASGTIAPIVTGLDAGKDYLWYLDGVEQGEVEADKDGTIALSYQSTGLHELSVEPTPMTKAMDGLADAIGIVAVLAVIGGLITMVGRIKF